MNINIRSNDDSIRNNFVDKINRVYEEAIGVEQYGNMEEFYDESGVVLMVAEHDYDENGKETITFNFGDSENTFEVTDIENVDDMDHIDVN